MGVGVWIAWGKAVDKWELEGEALRRRAAEALPGGPAAPYLAIADNVRNRNVSVSFCRRDASVSSRSAASVLSGGLK